MGSPDCIFILDNTHLLPLSDLAFTVLYKKTINIPPNGNKQMSHLFLSRKSVTKSSAYKNKAEEDPANRDTINKSALYLDKFLILIIFQEKGLR